MTGESKNLSPNQKLYALFRDGEQISKPHFTKEAVSIEAYELGAVIDYGADFPGDKSGRCLMDGYEIREVLWA